MLNSTCPGKEEPLAKRNGYRVVNEIRNLNIFKFKVLISVKYGRLLAEVKWPSITVQDISIYICSLSQYSEQTEEDTDNPRPT